jgi:hypothetical protein
VIDYKIFSIKNHFYDNTAIMGNAIYGKNLSCFDKVEHCAEHCGKYECVFVDKCNGNANLNYICLPIDTRYLTYVFIPP